MSRDTTNSSTTPKPTGLEFLDEYSGHIGTLYNNSMLPLTNVAGADAVTADVVPALPSGGLAIGMKFSIVWAQNNTGAATLNIDGSGAKSIIAKDGSALQAGNLAAGATDLLIYDGSGFVVFSGGTAVGGESGRIVFDVTGTWVNNLPDDTIVMVECWGAGGGGRYNQNGGGAGGAYRRAFFKAGELPSTVTVSIPSGGAVKGGVGTSRGGSCSFGNHVTAYGGVSSSTPETAVSGVGPNGDIPSDEFQGGKSAINVAPSDAAWGGAGGSGVSSFAGGVSEFGGDGGTRGQAGSRPGGGGGYNAPGGPGRCIITVF